MQRVSIQLIKLRITQIEAEIKILGTKAEVQKEMN